MPTIRRCTAFALIAFVAGMTGGGRPAGAQSAPAPKIKDNSFLIEEAYNQEAGVVQHISTFSRATSGRGFSSSFTQEWPVTGMRHQFSYTVPLFNDGSSTGVGDVALNYRFQLAGLEGGRLAMAPRVSFLVASGDESTGRGAGGWGIQANLPLSWEFSDRFTGHGNAGLTHTPRAQDASAIASATTSYGLGASLIFLATPKVNLMLESVWSSNEVVVGGTTARSESFVVAPGIRRAFDFASGLQVVPGLAYVVNLEPADIENLLFVYLSFEHPFKR